MATRFPPDPAILLDAVISVTVAVTTVTLIDTLIWAFG
jgi:hypothetical protein